MKKNNNKLLFIVFIIFCFVLNNDYLIKENYIFNLNKEKTNITEDGLDFDDSVSVKLEITNYPAKVGSKIKLKAILSGAFSDNNKDEVINSLEYKFLTLNSDLKGNLICNSSGSVSEDNYQSDKNRITTEGTNIIFSCEDYILTDNDKIIAFDVRKSSEHSKGKSIRSSIPLVNLVNKDSIVSASVGDQISLGSLLLTDTNSRKMLETDDSNVYEYEYKFIRRYMIGSNADNWSIICGTNDSSSNYYITKRYDDGIKQSFSENCNYVVDKDDLELIVDVRLKGDDSTRSRGVAELNINKLGVNLDVLDGDDGRKIYKAQAINSSDDVQYKFVGKYVTLKNGVTQISTDYSINNQYVVNPLENKGYYQIYALALDGKRTAQSEEKIVFESEYNNSEAKKMAIDDLNYMRKKWVNDLNIKDSEVDNYVDMINFKTYGKLKQVGKKLVSSRTNEEVELNGVSLFHLVDYGNTYNKANLSTLKYWGVNALRLPAYLQTKSASSGCTKNCDYVTPKDDGLDSKLMEYYESMDRIIDIASDLGFYVMIDFHCLGENGSLKNWQDLAKDFFTHFGQKYGKQDNIIWELANEPFSTSNEDLADYSNVMVNLIKNYDSNPVIVIGENNSSGKLQDETYRAIKEKINDDFFISIHYYNHQIEDLVKDGNVFQPNIFANYYNNGIPLAFTEWSNVCVRSCNQLNIPLDHVKMVTENYLDWWSNNKIPNFVFMLTHASFGHSLWNNNLVASPNLLKYGVGSEKYLSENGKVALFSYYNSAIRVVNKKGIVVRVPNTNSPSKINLLVKSLIIIVCSGIFIYFYQIISNSKKTN